MNSIQEILDMIVTEAILEGGVECCSCPKKSADASNLPPIHYELELLERPDGTLYWVE